VEAERRFVEKDDDGVLLEFVLRKRREKREKPSEAVDRSSNGNESQ
jgi:hypothetical protein